MDRSDDLRSWRLFAAIAKTGSISSACAMFQADAANLSRQLSQFEGSLGAGPLLDRSVRPMALTENGKAAFECAQKMLQLRNDLTQTLNCDPQALAGVIRVGFGLPNINLSNLSQWRNLLANHWPDEREAGMWLNHRGNGVKRYRSEPAKQY